MFGTSHFPAVKSTFSEKLGKFSQFDGKIIFNPKWNGCDGDEDSNKTVAQYFYAQLSQSICSNSFGSVASEHTVEIIN